MKNKPTIRQQEKFWAWTGIYTSGHVLPALTLDNLFKYAVPKVYWCNVFKFTNSPYTAIVTLDEHSVAFDAQANTPELAIFYAIKAVANL